MDKRRCRKQNFRCNVGGMSLIELLTCVMIIGIATAGSMELAYVNAFWAANGMNKADNLYAARRFLDVLNRDLRNTIMVDSHSTSQNLILSRSLDLDQEAGFPTNVSHITYSVSVDPASSDTVATDYYIQRTEENGAPLIVLTGLIGPTVSIGSPPAVFVYSSLGISGYGNSTDGLSSIPNPITLSQPDSILVNLELKRVSAGSSTSAMNNSTNHSFEAIRSEIFLRNSSYSLTNVAQ